MRWMCRSSDASWTASAPSRRWIRPATGPVHVRFLWLQTDTPTPRSEQAMSVDGGETWEINWTIDFGRASADA
jgi:hypothetical protein